MICYHKCALFFTFRPSAARATKRQTHVEVKIKPRQAASPSKNPVSAKLGEVINYIENNRLNIFWITLYTLLCLAIFAERAYCKFKYRYVLDLFLA